VKNLENYYKIAPLQTNTIPAIWVQFNTFAIMQFLGMRFLRIATLRVDVIVSEFSAIAEDRALLIAIFVETVLKGVRRCSPS
jgi:hypothetical protein